MKNGLFVVFEGIDGAGKETQINYLQKEIKKLSIYNDVLTTHEPWRSKELRERLKEEDAYSHGEKMAELYVQDRKQHQEKIILPNLEQGVIVLCDRYMLSTFAYQGSQGIAFDRIKQLHEDEGIIKPDLTLFLDVDLKIARTRIKKRNKTLEKFEKDPKFVKKLINNYRELAETSRVDQTFFGRVGKINANRTQGKVAEDVFLEFDFLYDWWVEYALKEH